ncbi:hypothetical protein NIES4071_73130 [Calothrix sp. NIES-4071]|nr:hypothetical protein NIES4071_73130 [Calothrix sp. NIES-4071]BAZ61588.1 hypothetical protein NIES4105_73080 [Calothrix sp. NIES-4105]
MHKQKISLAAAVGAFIAVGTVTVPAQAALLDFSFTTQSGATGSFTLDTDTPPSPQPSVGGGLGFPGILYPNAVSNFSLSSSLISLSNVSTDYEVIPSLTSNVIGLPPALGVLSGAVYPPGCSVGTSFRCLVSVGVLYAGNLSELPTLSDDPNFYPRVLNIDFSNLPTGQVIVRDFVTNSQVVRRQTVPESNSGLATLAFGIGSVALRMKRILENKGLSRAASKASI